EPTNDVRQLADLFTSRLSLTLKTIKSRLMLLRSIRSSLRRLRRQLSRQLPLTHRKVQQLLLSESLPLSSSQLDQLSLIVRHQLEQRLRNLFGATSFLLHRSKRRGRSREVGLRSRRQRLAVLLERK